MAYSTIDKPESYFNTVLWTGNNSSPRNITTGHATDFAWVKFRSSAFNHRLFDNVRGGSKKLISNNTDAEDTGATGDVTGFISTGFTIGSNINNSADGTLVGWSWVANGTGVSNTAGSITSTVSANTTSGFSIIKFTASGSGNQSVGHGLGVAPKMFITKATSSSSSWNVYHASLNSSSPQDYYLNLDLSNASSNLSGVFGAGMTSSVCGVGVGVGISSGVTYIGYAFAEVKGYSKFGSYTGNGSADGTFVYTGFSPAFLMIKQTNTSGENWYMWDNKRATYNVADNRLYPNLSNSEDTTNLLFDFLSNGFKLRSTYTGFNQSGGTFVYMAFASNPFVSSKSIPTTAR
jgi:hypothetical protein